MSGDFSRFLNNRHKISSLLAMSEVFCIFPVGDPGKTVEGITSITEVNSTVMSPTN